MYNRAFYCVIYKIYNGTFHKSRNGWNRLDTMMTDASYTCKGNDCRCDKLMKCTFCYKKVVFVQCWDILGFFVILVRKHS